jgi:hypothetical protein
MTGAALSSAVLTHLDRQLESARRLLDAVLRQGAAIRAHEVDAVLKAIEEIGSEMEARSRLEAERGDVLARAAVTLGVAPADVTLERLALLLDAPSADAARRRSAELRGLLSELSREHGINRALMRQELQFLDYLTRMTVGEPEPGYRRDAGGVARQPSPVPAGAGHLRLLDTRA